MFNTHSSLLCYVKDRHTHIGLQSPLQWNPSIMATIGTKDFGHYRGVATNQEFYKYYFNGVGTKLKVSGHYREVAMHSSEVAIKRGFHCNTII